jgi:uncharacterized protein (TIGR02444 family)
MAHNPFWSYSLRVYKRQAVAPSCIALQDRAGIDVNLLLFCLWAGRNGVALKATTMKAALSVSNEWRVAVVQPLRNVRRHLKEPAQSSPALRTLRERVLASELQAERLQQDALYALARPVKPGKGEPAMLAADNLAAYCRAAGIRLASGDWAALKTIVRAAL